MTRNRSRPDDSKNPSYITAEGYRRLEEEAHRLWTIERPKIVKAVAIAAAEGDRSENAEYIYGKRKLFEIDRRLTFLGKRLDVLKIVDEKPREDGRVYFASWVTLEDEDGVQRTLQIVGPDETDLAGDKLSCEAPMARALLGRCEGDDVTVQRPKGDVELHIVAVRVTAPQPR